MNKALETERLSEERLEAMLSSLDDYGGNYTAPQRIDTMRSLLTELLSLRRSPNTGGVKVKGLEWQTCATYQVSTLSVPYQHGIALWFSETAIGTYGIVKGTQGRYEAWLNKGQISGSFGAEDEAKAAAEADYRNRILSSLDLSQAERGGEVVAWRWETESEHIARDMKEGRFPERSSRIRVQDAAPAPATFSEDSLTSDDLQLLMRLRDNQQNNIHDVVEHDPEMWALGRKLSDCGLLAMVSHPKGGTFHITRLGLQRLTAALSNKSTERKEA